MNAEIGSIHEPLGPPPDTLGGSFVFKRALMAKKQLYGGLPPRHIRLIRNYLRELSDPDAKGARFTRIYLLWCRLVIYSNELDDLTRPDEGTVDQSTFNALKAGLKVLKRKRIGRIWDWNPHQSFAALGITEGTSRRPSTRAPSNSYQQPNSPEF
jgi:hypothetical protein